ncbi:MAG: TrkH family potassium uptake protein [Bacteroidaceae bacterium]|nr:TrkH family potassium uptake protein [Bacteroidaceae bacterium]
MINFKAIIKVIGDLLLLETVMLLLSVGVSAYYRDTAFFSLLVTAGITGITGLLMTLYSRNSSKAFTRRDGYIMVTCSWVSFAMFGMLPFYIDGHIPSLTNAFFEAMSGITSTGATILDDIDSMPQGLLFWRSITQWFGGLGIIIFTIALLPFLGVSGLQMFAAEVSGPTHNKVNPRIGITARWIWSIYIGITALLMVLLWLGGMGGFDSICHALTAAGTGGFSTHQESIAFYHSPYIEYVIIVFMFISGINYSLLILFISGRVRRALQDSELKWYGLTVVCATILFTIVLWASQDLEGEEAFRNSLFQVVSLQTSTGFTTTDYMVWPSALWGLLLLIMLVGACAGSTSGGMKCIRVQVLFKVMKNEFKHILHPNAVLPVRMDKQVAPPSLVTTVMAFCFLYFIIIFGSSIFLSSIGIDFMEAIGCSVSALGNMGPALGSYGPSSTWNSMPDAGKWLMSLLMLLGRLEIFTVILLFTPNFWKRN